MVSFSIGVRPYSDTRGAVVVIPLTAADDFAGPAAIELKNSIIANLEGQEFFLAGESCEVRLLEHLLLGDVNGDGTVNISDVTCLISYVLGGCKSSFHIENAEMNDDGDINISDVTALISRVLKGN